MSKLSLGEQARKDTIDSAEIILETFKGFQPKICIELGSGQKKFTDQVKEIYNGKFQEVPFSRLKFFGAKMSGHEGKVIATEDFWLVNGRLHTYEGHNIHRVVQQVRALALAGANKFIICSAAGTINPSILPGELVCIKDDIYRTGTSPLNMPYCTCLLGDEFMDMSNLYCPELKSLIQLNSAEVLNRELIMARLGVFIDRRGYEKPAEVALARSVNCDIVGVSIAPQVEALAGMPKKYGIKVAGLSCITNSHCHEHRNQSTTHSHVVSVAEEITEKLLSPLLFRLIKDLTKSNKVLT